MHAWVQSTDRRDGVSPTDVNTIAIGRVKRKVWREARRSGSFSRPAYRRKGVRMLMLRYAV